jgi:hypothetical protein
MSTLLLITVLVAAVRGLWSPCGLSMLSSLNPVSEQARGHRFWLTALWYLAGAVAGGALLGGACALGAVGIDRSSPPTVLIWSLVLAGASVAVASDLRLGGWSLPVHPRQVDVRWLSTYRRWIYSAGYGLQIGTGFATYIMSAAVYLLAALAVLTGRPAEAFAAGVLFGLARGLGIALAAYARDPGRLRSLLARVDAAAAPSVLVAAVAQTGVATAAAWFLAGPLPAASVAVLLGAAVLTSAWTGRRTVAAS